MRVCIILPQCFFFLRVVFLSSCGDFLHSPLASSSFKYVVVSFILQVVHGSFSLWFFFFFFHFPHDCGSSFLLLPPLPTLLWFFFFLFSVLFHFIDASSSSSFVDAGCCFGCYWYWFDVVIWSNVVNKNDIFLKKPHMNFIIFSNLYVKYWFYL